MLAWLDAALDQGSLSGHLNHQGDAKVIARVSLLSLVLQTAQQSFPPSPPPPSRSRLFIPSDKPEDPRGGGLKDLDGPRVPGRRQSSLPGIE